MGILLSLLTAVFQTAQDVTSKGALRSYSPVVVLFSLSAFGLPTLLLGLTFGMPTVSNVSWWLFLAFLCALCDSLGLFFYVKSMSLGELSQVIPLASIGPVIAMFFALFWHGEVLSKAGLLGVLLIVIGTYLVNLNLGEDGWLKPFQSIITERAPRYMLLACLVFAVAWNVHKAGLAYSNAVQWAVACFVFRIIQTLPFALVDYRKHEDRVRSSWGLLFLIGTFSALTFLTGIFALNFTMIGYVSSIKRLCILLSIVAGYFIFHETNFRQRFLGGICMVAGVVVIALLR
ncbi:MAG: DMT family transporter [Bdellovibrionales bacterium]|nr:DMT family transporter [Bdellovibrionales bacterium]